MKKSPCFRENILCIVFLLALSLLAECGSEKSSSDEPFTAAALIGPSGGTLEGPMGSMIEIPPGALSDITEISITLFKGNSSLPRGWAPLPGFAGAASFGPDGITFLLPVKITIPLNTAMTPGETFPLLYLDTGTGIWVQSAFTAEVSADGMFFSAEIDHFSGYGGASFQNLLNGGSAQRFMTEFVQWFESSITKQGDKSVKENTCFEVVGIAYDLSFVIDGQAGGAYHLTGRTSEYPEAPLLMIDYNYEESDGQSYDATITLTVVIYNDCTAPDMTLQADPAILTEGQNSAIEANLTCNGTAMTGKEVNFTIESGPGEINPGLTTSNSSGIATTTFTAGDDDATIQAYHDACDAAKSVTRTVLIRVAPDTYYLSIDFSQSSSLPDYYDSMYYSGVITMNITGTNPDDTAAIEGSNTFTVTGSGYGGDCTTTTQGEVTFSIEGTIEYPASGTPLLHLTISPAFNTTKTISCPDQGDMTFPYMVGGEPYSFTEPLEDGRTWGTTISEGGITSTIEYTLNF